MSDSRSIPVSALSPLACGAVVWRMGGVTRVTLVAKATFAIVPGGAAEPAPPLPLAPHDKERGPARALDEASDMAPYLSSAGVILRGTAHARGGPQPSVIVSLGVFKYQWLVRKRLVVRGDPSSAGGFSPFSSMPLAYERAVGGPGALANPSGSPRAANIVDPENVNRPAGFGPVSPSWSPRRELAPTSGPPDPAALDLQPNFDFRYFQAAPPDQQFAYIEGDEWIALEGVHPSLDLIRTRIPPTQASGRVWLPNPGGAPATELPVRMAGDTLNIDADRMIFSVTWRGHCELPRGDVPHGTTAAVGLSLPNQPVVFPPPPRRGRHVFDGTAAVNDAEIARARERVGAPFAVAKPAAGASAEAGSIHATPFVRRDAPKSDAPKSDAPRSAPKDVINPAPPVDPLERHRRRSPLESTVEQKDPPRSGPIAPFPIAAPGAAAPSSAIPGAPFQPYGAPDVRFAADPPGVDPQMRSAPLDLGVTLIPAERPARSTSEAAVTAAPPSTATPPPEMVTPPVMAVMPPVMAATPPASTSTPTGMASTPPVMPLAPPPVEAVSGPAEQGIRAVVLERARRSAAMGDLDLAGIDLSGLDLGGAILERQNLRGSNLAGCKLTGARLVSADLTGADLTGADLRDVDLTGADLTRVTLTRARLDGARMEGATLVSARGSEARFTGALLDRADMRTVRLTDSSFDGARLRDATAARADFSGCRFVRADLSAAMLRGSKLARAVLAFATIAETDLREANLEGANLHSVARGAAKLSGANLRGVTEEAPPPDADEQR